MNIVFLSPHFPPNYYLFCCRLKQRGHRVFGIGDEDFERMRPELQHSLSEYYRVNDMHHLEELKQACRHFQHRWGTIDCFESLNEHWLTTETLIREEFDIPGLTYEELTTRQLKSGMKRLFALARVPVAKGAVVLDHKEASHFIDDVGFPVVAKPDRGVGAGDTFCLKSWDDVTHFFENQPSVPYIFEEYVEGEIRTFDGLTDSEGNILFFTSMRYSDGVMEIVNQDLDLFYYSSPVVFPQIEEYGRRIIKAFDIKRRFFHIEFFLTSSGEVIALEVNLRPPGGLTLDLFNFAYNRDLYDDWAAVITGTNGVSPRSEGYYCGHVGRKDRYDYRLTHEQVLASHGDAIIHHQPMHPLYHRAMGAYSYILRTTREEEWLSRARDILAHV